MIIISSEKFAVLSFNLNNWRQNNVSYSVNLFRNIPLSNIHISINNVTPKFSYRLWSYYPRLKLLPSWGCIWRFTNSQIKMFINTASWHNFDIDFDYKYLSWNHFATTLIQYHQNIKQSVILIIKLVKPISVW